MFLCYSIQQAKTKAVKQSTLYELHMFIDDLTIVPMFNLITASWQVNARSGISILVGESIQSIT